MLISGRNLGLVENGSMISDGGMSFITDLATWGTYVCPHEKFRITGTHDDGSTPSIAWSPKNRRPIDYRSGSPMLRLSGQKTNVLLSSEAPLNRAGGGWSYPGGTLGTDVFPHPDGAIGAGRYQNAAWSTGANYIVNPVTSNLDWCASAYVRAPSGTKAAQFMIGGSTVTPAAEAALTTTWRRLHADRLPDNAFGQLAFWFQDARDWTSYGGIGAQALDAVYWGLQLEQASYASDPIRTEGLGYGAETSDATVLSGPIATIPSKMLNGSWSFLVAPMGPSGGMIRQNATQTLFSFAEDASERISFEISGGSLYLRVYSGGALKVSSNALTFSRDQVLTVAVDGASGSITVSGATSGNGTVSGTTWTRTPGSTLYVGALSDGTQHFDGGLWCAGAPAPTVSSSKFVVFTLGQSNMTQHAHMDRIVGWMQEYHPHTKLIDGSQGSTSLAVDWNKSGGTQYAAAVAAWNAAVAADPTLTTYTPIIVWVQGEADAANGTYASNYGTNLAALKTNLETDIPQLVGARWAVGQLSSNTTTGFGATSITIGQVRTAQASFVSGLGSLGCIVDPSDLTFDPSPANLHFDNDSIHTYAARIVAALRGIGV